MMMMRGEEEGAFKMMSMMRIRRGQDEEEDGPAERPTLSHLIPSPPLPASPPTFVLPASPPASPIRPLGYRAAMIRLRAEAASTSHSLPLPPPIILSHTRPVAPSSGTPPLHLLSTDRREDIPEVCLPPQKRLGIDLGPRYEIGESSSAAAARPIGGRMADYGFVGTMDTEIRQQRAEEVGYRIRDVWVALREAVEEYHYETARLLDQEALVSQEAWGRSIEVSYMARLEIMALHSVVMGQQAVISPLQAADHRRAACVDFDIDAVTTGTGDHFTGTGDSTAWTAGTLWRSSTASSSMHVMQLGMAMTAIPREQVSGGLNALLESTYQDSMKCQPLYFKGTEGVVELTQWFERMETVFHISNCSVDNQIKFSTCTLLAGALTWWDSYVRIVGQDVAYEMTWTNLRKKMTDKYCPRNEMKKLEVEL
ncbi:hypothetical protein Tco_0085531 [Tanacetum coccineum]